MDIFVFAFAIVIILKIYYHSNIPAKDKKKNICIILGVLYFVIAAFRHKDVGGDTYNYVNFLRSFSNYDFKQVLIHSKGSDPVFYLCLSILGRMTQNYTILLSLVALVFSVSVMRFIYKYSNDPCFSWIILLALNIYQFTLTGMRQTIAIAIILYAIDYYLRDKPVKSILLCLFASLFHFSAITVVIALVILRFLKKKNFMIVSPVIALLILGTNTIFVTFLSRFMNSSEYTKVSTGAGGITMALVIFTLYIVCLIVYPPTRVNQERDKTLMALSFLGVVFEMLVPAQPIYFRFAFYFLPALSIVFPSAIMNTSSIRSRRIVGVVFFFLLSFQYILITRGSCYILPYKFFWQ